MLFDIPYIAAWTAIGQQRQRLVDQNNAQENARRIDFDYAIGQKVLLKKRWYPQKVRCKVSRPLYNHASSYERND